MIQMRTYDTREEWLKARKSYIGGSDAAAVLGMNPWMSNTELWEIKTGRRKKTFLDDNEFVKYGHAV
jgi:predicted phage-related endonuclease